MIPFKERIIQIDPDYVKFDTLKTLQVNLGDKCNLECIHCHVSASDKSSKMMGRVVMDQVADFLLKHPDVTLDITGGCPEMNPDFRYFIERTKGVVSRRLLRSNLVIMAERGWEWLPDFCQSHGLTVIGSLPCYLEDNVDYQRGRGVYQKCIEAIQILNSLGYGKELELNLVYNPGSASIPPSQKKLESLYKRELSNRYDIVFNNLYTITNAPIGRFRQNLESLGMYEEYIRLLGESFNPLAAENIMCRTLVSVDWQGKLYNCDFNQSLEIAVRGSDGSELEISVDVINQLRGREIIFSQYCYCCTAGEGSSCTGALNA